MRFSVILCLASLCASAFAADAPPSARLSRELMDYLKRPEAQVRVLDGALLICKQAHPELDLDAERKAFKKLAADLSAALAGASAPRQQAEALSQLLFNKEQFGLPERDDSTAFLLTDVLHNKRGNCLGLSVLCLALAEETGLKLYGVPVPSRSSDSGHMFVRFDDGTTRRNFDPAQKGLEHADAYYQHEFKLTENDLRTGYVLGNAKRRDVLALILVNLGGAYLDEQRVAEALPVLEAALSIRPESAGAQSNMAAAKLMQGDSVGAEKHYAAALRIDANYFPARIGQADLALRKNDPNASKLVDSVLAIEPENVQARTMLASLQLQRKDLAGALKTLNDLSALPTADVSVWNNLGRCYAMSGDMALSETSYRRALVYDDHSAEAHCGLARALVVNGKKTDATAEFEAALKIDSKNAAAKAGLTELATSASKPIDAPKKLESVAQKPPDYPRGTTVLPFKIVANRIFVTVRINDSVDAEALVDTGAEVSLLNSARVKVIGLKPTGAENLLGSMVGRIPTQTVVVDTLTIGGSNFKNQTILRVDQGPGTKFELIDFVLGMDILSTSRFTLDFERSEMVLWPVSSKPLAPGPNVERVQTALVSSAGTHSLRPHVAATINQKNAVTFLVDTGADAAMIVVYKKPAELGYAVSEPPAAMARVFDSNIKSDLPVYLTTFATLEIGKANFKEVEGRIVDASTVFGPVARSGLVQLNVIGTPFLKTLLALHIDFLSKTISFDRAKSTP
jgi:regulator of sirC expression with transglutaminase-like and TPR domain/predicted aspartyl protease